ncbi:hypothetical protein [Acetomicrobium hydrogeniformans]|jgi:hypothetical protein|uniref:Uncharacterized protein n=1 Tax=Acetomicrobium hydrogeniformans ATCC BAA-1850 TaxID=592015 RepID=A0A0T5X8M4_9BACT|nr:hypothetical protein [Acetomicrobium hydrogeniformans]KRT34500.1 hypothetical protein HMPREF1705_03222 [Acetomicrobium hydrogeniformans ATCC BAA-1850]
MRKRSLLLISVILVLVFLYACGACAAQKTGVTEGTVKNFTYHLAFGERSVTLKDGEYEEPHPDYLHVWIDNFIIDDVDRDGAPDAVVVLAQNGGGSGTFFELTALLATQNGILQTNSVSLGDRVKIDSIKVVENSEALSTSLFEPKKIVIDMLTHKESDPLYSPSERMVLNFALYEDELVSYEDVPPTIVKKPAIYLYPQKETKVRVKVDVNGEITESIPQYGDGWEVTASPKGKIDGKYDYLFYEARLNSLPQLPEEGWVVAYGELGKWFDENLPALGLNGKEARDLKEYWIKSLKPAKYYVIKLLDRNFIDENLKLQVSPTPQTVIRLMLYFKPTDHFDILKAPKPQKTVRVGFTVVEWGGIVEDSDADVCLKPAYSLLPDDTGILLLRAVNVGQHKLSITVNSGGCTDKDTIKAVVNKVDAIDGQVPVYELTFLREKPDLCKAFLPEGVVVDYDLEKDFGFKMPYVVTVTNPVPPIVKDEPYFTISSIRIEIEEPKATSDAPDDYVMLKKGLIDATVRAIRLEINRYEASNHSDKQEKIDYLKEELARFEGMKPQDYVLEAPEGQKGDENPLDDFGKFGPALPPEEREGEIIVTDELEYGLILTVTGMTRSGPFYHVAGVMNDDFKTLTPGKHKVKLYLVYKRECFGGIPDYYVFIGDKLQ